MTLLFNGNEGWEVMNCPYCDENVHAMSKFCPKCGLPLKEDSTVMGAYASDDTGPGLWVIGGGLAAILVVTLIIGWATSQGGNKPVDTVQRQPAINPAPGLNPAGRFGSEPINPALYGGFGRQAAGPSANYNPQVRWAYVPPANPVQKWQGPIYIPPAGPEAPPHTLIQDIAREVKAPPVVIVARADTPVIPSSPAVPAPLWYGAGQVAPSLSEPAYGDFPQDPAAALRTPAIRQLEEEGVVTYDPVQEQYVIVPGKRRRGVPGPGVVRPAPPQQNVEGQ